MQTIDGRSTFPVRRRISCPGVEAAINEDVFDLDDLEEEELLDEEGEGVGTPSVASTAFYSTVREVSLQIVLRLVFCSDHMGNHG